MNNSDYFNMRIVYVKSLSNGRTALAAIVHEKLYCGVVNYTEITKAKVPTAERQQAGEAAMNMTVVFSFEWYKILNTVPEESWFINTALSETKKLQIHKVEN